MRPAVSQSPGQRASLGQRAGRSDGAAPDAMMTVVPVIRLVTVQDAAALAELLTVNREFLAPCQPIRADEFFTTGGQREAIEDALQWSRARRDPACTSGRGLAGRSGGCDQPSYWLTRSTLTRKLTRGWPAKSAGSSPYRSA